MPSYLQLSAIFRGSGWSLSLPLRKKEKKKLFNTEQKSLRCQPSYRLSRILLHFPIILCHLYQGGVSTDTAPVTDSFGHVRDWVSTRTNFHGSLPPDPFGERWLVASFPGAVINHTVGLKPLMENVIEIHASVHSYLPRAQHTKLS